MYYMCWERKPTAIEETQVTGAKLYRKATLNETEHHAPDMGAIDVIYTYVIQLYVGNNIWP
jgi:hypothetical protein